MTRGRKGNQTFTGFNGASDAGLRKARLAGRPESSLAYSVVPPSPDAMRAAINDGKCPFCGNPYKNIGLHTRNTHGVSADELKDLAGIPKSRPVCAEEYTKACRDRALAEDAETKAERVQKMRSNLTGGPRKFSKAGRAVQKQKLDAVRTPEFVKRVGEMNSQRRLAAAAERDAEIVRRVQQGEWQKDIARDMGIVPETVKRALIRAGITSDMRGRANGKKWQELEVNPFTKEPK